MEAALLATKSARIESKPLTPRRIMESRYKSGSKVQALYKRKHLSKHEGIKRRQAKALFETMAIHDMVDIVESENQLSLYLLPVQARAANRGGHQPKGDR